MKNDVRATVKTLMPAEIDLSEVRFDVRPQDEIFFYNKIDAWRKMEIVFHHRIKRPSVNRTIKDSETFYYSFREGSFNT